jgi:serine kinase of HPr protein (carbohydrate metabolism regulator)
MHGSCFVYNKKGIMLCGDSGVGKSCLTASFVIDGYAFLTDDVTPILISKNKPFIWTMSDRIKLWDDSLKQLKQDREGLHKINPELEKFYYPLKPYKDSTYMLHHIFLIEIHEKSTILFQEITGAEKVIALRKEIYRLEYIQGMPENEGFYFKNLAEVSKNIKITKLFRPKNVPIEQTKNRLIEYLDT